MDPQTLVGPLPEPTSNTPWTHCHDGGQGWGWGWGRGNKHAKGEGTRRGGHGTSTRGAKGMRRGMGNRHRRGGQGTGMGTIEGGWGWGMEQQRWGGQGWGTRDGDNYHQPTTRDTTKGIKGCARGGRDGNDNDNDDGDKPPPTTTHRQCDKQGAGGGDGNDDDDGTTTTPPPWGTQRTRGGGGRGMTMDNGDNHPPPPTTTHRNTTNKGQGPVIYTPPPIPIGTLQIPLDFRWIFTVLSRLWLKYKVSTNEDIPTVFLSSSSASVSIDQNYRCLRCDMTSSSRDIPTCIFDCTVIAIYLSSSLSPSLSLLLPYLPFPLVWQ